MSNGATYRENSSLYSDRRVGLLDRLFTSVYGQIDTAREGAAFQIAVWEITHDNGLDVSRGGFRAGGNNGATRLAQRYLNGLRNADTGGYNLRFFESRRSQDLVTAAAGAAAGRYRADGIGPGRAGVLAPPPSGQLNHRTPGGRARAGATWRAFFLGGCWPGIHDCCDKPRDRRAGGLSNRRKFWAFYACQVCVFSKRSAHLTKSTGRPDGPSIARRPAALSRAWAANQIAGA